MAAREYCMIAKMQKTPAYSIMKKTVNCGSGLSMSVAVLYKKDISALLRRRKAMSSSQDFEFFTQDAGKARGILLVGRRF